MKRVLIVDDDRPTRRVLQILVEKLGLESSAHDGAEAALDALRNESAALVLTDLKMPGIDGIAFMRELRSFDPQSGALLGSVEIPGGATTDPVVAVGVLYVVSSRGQLHAFR